MKHSPRRPKKADPIFAVIERLRRAELALDATGDDQSPSYNPGNNKPLHKKWRKALWAFVTMVPTSSQGLVAFSSYLNEAQKRMCGAAPYLDTGNAEAFAETLDKAVQLFVGRPRSTVHAA
jgi:hypothetical protein